MRHWFCIFVHSCQLEFDQFKEVFLDIVLVSLLSNFFQKEELLEEITVLKKLSFSRGQHSKHIY